MPRTGRAFLLAMLALMGLPPFGLFVSEVMIFRAGFEAGFLGIPLAGIALLVLAFAGLLRALHRMLYGTESRAVAEIATWAHTVPVIIALALLVVTGIAWPAGLAAALDTIAAVVGH
jgi:hydrogenase-4 component F